MEPIKRMLCSIDVKVVQKPLFTLRHIFAKPKGHIAKEQREEAFSFHSVQ